MHVGIATWETTCMIIFSVTGFLGRSMWPYRLAFWLCLYMVKLEYDP